MIKLIIAEDEALIRGALSSLLNLEDDFDIVAEAVDGAEAIVLAKQHNVNVVLLDLEMPHVDGIESAEKIIAATTSKIVIMTRHARPGVLRRALSAGVSGFVTKSTPSDKLANIIRDVAKGQHYVDPEIAVLAISEKSSNLSSRELDVLRLTKAGDSVAQISTNLHLAQGTVRNYLSTAMEKLHVNSRKEAANIAWSHGWI